MIFILRLSDGSELRVEAGQLPDQKDADRGKIREFCDAYIEKHKVSTRKRFDDAWGDLIVDGKVAYVIPEIDGRAKIDMMKLFNNHPMPSNRDHILTVFAPGLGASLGQAAKYTKEGNEFIYNVWGGDRLFSDDALPFDVWQPHPAFIMLVITHVTLAVLTSLRVAHMYLSIALCLLPLPIAMACLVAIAGWFKGNESMPYLPLPWRVNVGQQQDVQHYLNIVQMAARAEPEKDLVLFGTSRGGAVVAQAYAMLPENLRTRVKLVISECPFDNVDEVLRDREFFLSPWVNTIIRRWLPRLTAYDPNAPSPGQVLRDTKNLPTHIPLAFITSNLDVVVKRHHTTALSRAADVHSERRNVHFLTLDRSSHSGYPVDDEMDRESYKQFLDGLYNMYVPAPDSK